jgi:uncharacterized membrane protein (DUF485 family)
MPQLEAKRMRNIFADPAFRELASRRAKLRWGLSIATLIMFFGFIVLMSTARNTLAASVGGSTMPLGLVLAIVMIAVVVVLTGIYVQQSNSRFDELTRALQREVGP